MEKLKIVLPVLLAIACTGLIFLVSAQTRSSKIFSVSSNEFLNFQASYQILLLVITAISLLGTYFLNSENFLSYFSAGNISAPVEEMKWFGIKAGEKWSETGFSLTLSISLITGIFMFFQLKNADVEWSSLQKGILWILLFSLTNSFAEEMIYRVGIVSPLKGLLSPMTIFVISAVVFGIPHIAGMPGGIIGAIMAGILGLVLAKSLYETNGILWAWLIHFIQDVIIIGSLYLLSVKPV